MYFLVSKSKFNVKPAKNYTARDDHSKFPPLLYLQLYHCEQGLSAAFQTPRVHSQPFQTKCQLQALSTCIC